MNNIIIPILLGNNNGSLYGAENDAIIFYNLFYKFYQTNPLVWHEPVILINVNVHVNNITKLIVVNCNQHMKKNKDIIFIIYFSGHTTSKGLLKFYDEKVSASSLLDRINQCIKTNIQLYFIIDSCFSKNFICELHFNYIKKITFLVSCMENEYSKEIEINNFTINDKICITTSVCIVGIFTLYFVKLLEAREINNIIHFKDITNDKMWGIISLQYKQTIYYTEI